MRVISRARLREFWGRYPDAKVPLDQWYRQMKRAKYESPHDVRRDFASASFLKDGRTVFNIGGNKYRLTVDMKYGRGQVYLLKVQTHEEYDRDTL